MLYNPALDFTRDNLLARLNGNRELAKRLSPTMHLDKDTPPAILFYGTEDARSKPDGIAYRKQAQALGVRVELVLAEGEGHGYFNRPPWLQRTTVAADCFLQSLGFLQGAPTIEE